MTHQLALLISFIVILIVESKGASINLTEEAIELLSPRTWNNDYYNLFGLQTPWENVVLPHYYRDAYRMGLTYGNEHQNHYRNFFRYPFIQENVYSDESRPLENPVPTNFIPVPLISNLARVPPTFDSCISPSGESGICTTRPACNTFGGRPSGSCASGRFCCINSVSVCGGSITLNNTYWQSPVNQVSASSTCAVTVKVDSRLAEQRKPICQLRLDFPSFNIAQPNGETVCATDLFQVTGSNSKVPTICGDNTGQHMYLSVPSSDSTPSNVQLTFSFGSTIFTRAWSIKVSYLPCGATYLAPTDCLQYFSSASGTVRSFNWIDTAGTATRQLANQDYNICFRNELVNNQRTSSICYSACLTNNRPFSVSVANTAATGLAATSTAAAQSQNSLANCNNDYVLIPGGSDPAVATGPTNLLDRFCGEILNVAFAATVNAQVCTTGRPFSILYRTNADESTTITVDSNTRGNAGFCLTFTQKA